MAGSPLVDLTPDAERQALKELLESDGWAIYAQRGEEAWGSAACERALRESRKTTDPADWPFESTRILDTFEAMRAELRWPAERIRMIESGEKTLKQTVVDRFAHLRRAR